MTQPHDITQDLVKDLLIYNEESGDFIWRFRGQKYFQTRKGHAIWNGKYAGKLAGGVDTKGYLTIGLFNKSVRAHRLAILITEGFHPDAVDHINGCKLDNRRCNLRVASRSQNQFNQKTPCTNKSGVKGVWFDRLRNKWVSQIRENNKRHWVGEFNTLETAALAVKAARNKLHREFANHG